MNSVEVLGCYAVKLIFDLNPPSFRQQNRISVKSLYDMLVHFGGV